MTTAITSTPSGAAETEPYRLSVVGWAEACETLFAIRRTVFVDEHGLAQELIQDDHDQSGVHVLARDAVGAPVGAGRLLPGARLDRIAVLPDRRGRGLGRALGCRLLELARERGEIAAEIDAPRAAQRFCRRLGFEPLGEAFEQGGTTWRRMRLELRDWSAPPLTAARDLDGASASLAAGLSLIDGTRRQLWLYTPYLHPALYGSPALAEALEKKLGEQPRLQLRLLLPSPSLWRRRCPHLVGLLARRSAVELRGWPEDEARERAEFSYGFWLGDRSLLFHHQPHSALGRYTPDGGRHGQTLRRFFAASWERGVPDLELRQLGV